MNQNDVASYISSKKMLHLRDGLDSTLATINESFMTADESGNNSTQFFSVLEDSTTETILNDITYDNLEIDDREFTLSNATAESTIGKQEELEEEIPEDQELIIFKSPHSSKLYGLQSTQDEEGNLLKYQYEVL